MQKEKTLKAAYYKGKIDALEELIKSVKQSKNNGQL